MDKEILNGQVSSTWKDREGRFVPLRREDPTFGEALVADLQAVLAADARDKATEGGYDPNRIIGSIYDLITDYRLKAEPTAEDEAALSRIVSELDKGNASVFADLLLLADSGFDAELLEKIVEHSKVVRDAKAGVPIVEVKGDFVENLKTKEPEWYEEFGIDMQRSTMNIRRENRDRPRNQVDIDADEKIKVDARKRLKGHGVDIDELLKNEDERKIHDASMVLTGRFDPDRNGWDSAERAEGFLRDILGHKIIDAAGNDLVRKGIIGGDKDDAPVSEDKSEEENGEESLLTQKRNVFLDKMDLVVMDENLAKRMEKSGDRRRALQDLEKVVDLNYILGGDLEPDERQALKDRNKEMRDAIKAMRTGTVTEEQADSLIIAKIDVTEYGVKVVASSEADKAKEAMDQSEKDFILENGCRKELYDQVTLYCMNAIFIGGASSANEVMNRLVYNDKLSPWIRENRGKQVQLPDMLREKLTQMGFEAWIGVRDVMGEWRKLKDVDEITASSLRPELFFSRYQELTFSNMGSLVFPGGMSVSRVGGKKPERADFGKYEKSEAVESVEREIGNAMKIIFDYFNGNKKNDGSNKYATDYWDYVSMAALERQDLYESLGLNRYFGEAAFSFLLSNFMLAEKGVSVDPFCLVVNPVEKRIASYKIDPKRDPIVYSIVQEYRAAGLDRSGWFHSQSRRDRISAGLRISGDTVEFDLKRKLRQMIPNRLVPTGHDYYGTDNLDSGNWLKWWNDRYSATGKGEGNLPVARTDVDTRLKILRQAITLNDAVKKATKPEGGVELIEAVKSGAFIQEVAYLAGANLDFIMRDSESRDKLTFVNPSFDFMNENGEPRLSTPFEWVSRFNLMVIEVALSVRSIANNYNEKPLDMHALEDFIERVFKKDPLTNKNVFVGLNKVEIDGDGAMINDGQRMELISFVDGLWDRCNKVINTKWSSSNDYFKRLPDWYGKQPVSDEVLKIIRTNNIYSNLWGKFKRTMR